MRKHWTIKPNSGEIDYNKQMEVQKEYEEVSRQLWAKAVTENRQRRQSERGYKAEDEFRKD